MEGRLKHCINNGTGPCRKTVNVELELTPKQLEWWDAQTNTMRTIAETSI